MSDDRTCGTPNPVVPFARATAGLQRTPASPQADSPGGSAWRATTPDGRIGGVDVAEMRFLTGAALAAPDGARANWRVVTTWEPGPQGSWGLTRSRYDVDNAAEDQGDPTPQEQLLGVANASVIVGLRVCAAREGLRLDAIEVTSTADSDLCELVGLPTSSPGFRALDIQVATRGEGSAEQLDELVREVLAASPIMACLCHPWRFRAA